MGLAFNNQIVHRYGSASREHTRVLLPMIDSLLKEAELHLSDLDALACTIGPGSFTGVRIGTAVMQALSIASGKPVILISTLQAIAQHAYMTNKYERVFARLDAGQKEIYGACFAVDEKGIMQATSKESMMDPNNVILPPGNWVTVEGLPNADSLLKLARAKYELGDFVSAQDVQPVYLDNGQLFKKS